MKARISHDEVLLIPLTEFAHLNRKKKINRETIRKPNYGPQSGELPEKLTGLQPI